MEYNIYCDESCHLEHDNSNVMLIGGLRCEKAEARRIINGIKRIKKAHAISPTTEIKWSKVSPAKLDFYKDLFSFFIDSNMQFRGIIALEKKDLNNEAYNQSYDDWYYKMYYLLLSKMLDPTDSYNVFIDIKDTQGGDKTARLREILNNFLYSFHQTCLKHIQIVRSEEVVLLQLCDLLIGCVGYANRFYDDGLTHSPAKKEMCRYLQELSNRPLTQSTPLTEDKINLFVWTPRK